jgi:hypothetical protein
LELFLKKEKKEKDKEKEKLMDKGPKSLKKYISF